jgi:ubiquitin-like modifier-activating enzyme ATG7
MATSVTFATIESFFDPGFWSTFYDNKLEIYKLDDSGIPLLLQYSTSHHISLPPKLSAYGEFSFNPNHLVGSQSSSSPCTLFNYNSFQAFKDSDKKTLLAQQSTQIWQDMLHGEALKTPSLLTRSFIISYADLKQYLYTHWLCIPSFSTPDVSYTIQNQITPLNQYKLKQNDSEPTPISQWARIVNQIQDLTHNPVFIIDRANQNVLPFEEISKILQNDGKKSTFLNDYLICILDPSANPELFGWFTRNVLLYIGLLLNSYNVPFSSENTHSIQFVAIKNTRELQVSYQDLLAEGSAQQQQQQQQQQSHTSNVYSIDISNINTVFVDAINYMKQYRNDPINTSTSLPLTPPTTGWERYKNKPQPKQSSSKNLDPIRIYSQAGDMNLKLLKWQHWPEMPLPHIRSQKCLLIGSGTLGCYVSRLLLGWGVHNITMLDYGKVSASNPVRQPLFTYQDWVEKKSKAEAACAALKAIHPKANVTPVVLSIPSAGTVSEAEMPQALENAQKLAELVQTHDVIFLLTDSRASRWLPTLFAQAYGKRTIAAAIGPETYVAMRHGIRQGWKYTEEYNTSAETIDINGENVNNDGSSSTNTNSIGFGSFRGKNNDIDNAGEISCGCYFCPDQAAPVLGIPQSIDQQCTVTRAEVASLASSYAVNLFVHDVSHECTFHKNDNKKVQKDPENGNQNQNDEENCEEYNSKNSLLQTVTSCQTCELNSQIRGSVLTHVNPSIDSNSLTCPPSTTCVGCGAPIVKAFQQDPIGFLMATFSDAENVTKFSAFQAEFQGGSDWENDDWDLSDNGESNSDGDVDVDGDVDDL